MSLNCISVLISWTIPLFKKGLKKELEENDLFALTAKFGSEVLGEKLELAWKEQQTRFKKPSLWKALIKVFGIKFIKLSLFWFLIEGLR